MADAVTEAHKAHTAAQHDPAGSARAFLSEAALPAVRALKGAGAPTLLPGMHRIVNTVQPGLISPEAAPYGHWMESSTSNRSGMPPSMGDTLRLTGAGSTMSLHSSARALLHAIRTYWPGYTAPYLNQARATYPGGVSELDAALHLLHPPDEDLEVGENTVFMEGVGEAPTRPRPTNPVYDGTSVRGIPQRARLVPRPPAGDAGSPRLGQPALPPPPLQDQGRPLQGTRPLARAPAHPLAPPCRHDPRGPGAGPGDHPPPPVRGVARAPPPPPGARGAGRGTRLPADTGGHRRYGSPPGATPLGATRRPPGPQSPEPCPRLGAVARRVGRVAHPTPPQCRWMTTGPRPRGVNSTAGPPPCPPSPSGALQGTAHDTPEMH